MNDFNEKSILAAEVKDSIQRGIKKYNGIHLNISISSFGTYSIRYGTALVMYLSETSIVDIMLQGCWLSDAFILYIKRAIFERSTRILDRMLEHITFTILPPREH